jgi:hypothetical protein
MAKIKSLFQEGISLNEFMSEYGTEAQCTEALFKMKWASGYRCKHCDHDSYSYISQDTQSLTEFFKKHSDIENTKVCSDGLASSACQELGLKHERIVVSQHELRSVDINSFNWVNTALGNLKKFINGTHQAIHATNYISRYLAEFQYRFNRRFDLKSIFPRMLYACVISSYLPVHELYRSIVRN